MRALAARIDPLIAVMVVAALALLAGLVVLAFAAGASERKVRSACAHHKGVAVVTGNAFRKYVTCRDGHYEVIRWAERSTSPSTSAG
jgi:hypothetical protein